MPRKSKREGGRRREPECLGEAHIELPTRGVVDVDEYGCPTYTCQKTCRWCDTQCDRSICMFCEKGRYCHRFEKCTVCSNDDVKTGKQLHRLAKKSHDDTDWEKLDLFIAEIQLRPGGVGYEKAMNEFYKTSMCDGEGESNGDD